MLKALRELFTSRARGRCPRPARVEGLEKRSMLAATVVDERLFGPDPTKVQGVIITFSEAMDEVSAENVRNYRVGKRTDEQGFSDEELNSNKDDKKGLVKFTSAVYDPATFSVTLTAKTPFKLAKRFRNIRVLARQDQGVRDALGNLLDGDRDGVPGKDSLERFTFRRGKTSEWGELDGDNASLRITGPGRIWVIRQTKGGRVLARGNAHQVYIDRADPATSVVTGKVRGIGNGVVVIDELINTSTAQVQIATDPSFQIVRSIP